MSEVFDSLILGGGPGGSTAATLLARAGWSVAVVEKASFPRPKVCGEFLSPTNRPLFQELGIAESVFAQAGPPIERVGLFSGPLKLTASMPGLRWRNESGCAVGRDRLDSLLLDTATQSGAAVWQPWVATSLVKTDRQFVCSVVSKATQEGRDLRARSVIAAHGSWESGRLPTQVARAEPGDSDLFGFKAHFTNAVLPDDLMPLLVFPGGYGGMVRSDGGRLSLSCCVQRRELRRLRSENASLSAMEAVLRHIQETCPGARDVLEEARIDGAGLSIGPIQPGIRRSPEDGIFLVGNAAGEAHPIVAEGISMAMQSAWILCRRLIAERESILGWHSLRGARLAYEAEWRRCFGARIRAAAFFAGLALNPTSARAAGALLRHFPVLLRWGVRWSGKTRQIVAPALAT